jgi:hypothetical protein
MPDPWNMMMPVMISVEDKKNNMRIITNNSSLVCVKIKNEKKNIRRIRNG